LIGIGSPASRPRWLFHQRLGARSGAIEAPRRQRVDLAIDLTDPLLQHVEQIERRHFACFEFCHDGAGGLSHQSPNSQWRLSRLFAQSTSAVEHFPAEWQRRHWSMIRKSGHRFSEKITLKQEDGR
jgi:hypothetical protein